MNGPRKKYIRGYIIPNYSELNNQFEFVRDVTNEIPILNDYLKIVQKIYFIFFDKGIHNTDDLKKANDLYALIVHASLSFYSWKIVLKKWIEATFGKKINISNFIENEFYEFSSIAKKFYETFPADDAPGFNTSSLLIHLNSTSALSSCIAENKMDVMNLNLNQIEYIRTSSFFHEIGKPISRYNIKNNSINLINQYFGNIFSKDILEAIIKIIKETEERNPSIESKCVMTASKLSLAADRLKDIAIDILSPKIIDLKQNFDNPDFWEKSEEQLESLTHDFLNNYEIELKKKGPIELKYYNYGEIALIRGDVRHIHEYTDHVLKLEELRNASRLLDFALSVDLVLKMIKKARVNPENILYSSGGNIILFSPSSKVNQITSFIEEKFYNTMEKGLFMTTDFIYFYSEESGYIQDSFGDLYTRLAIKIGEKKNDLRFKTKQPVLNGSTKLCDSCGSKMAEIPIKKIDKLYCNSCHFKYELPNPEIKALSLQEEWKDYYSQIHDYIIEFISGVSIEEISSKKPNEFEVYKLAIINADGNLLGEFISKSISISDLYSRITRILNSVVEIFDEIERKIENIFGSIDNVRFKFGKIYFGGDDILLLVPGYLSFPISLTLIKEFYKKMGGKTTLSTGIFLCPNKFPIWTAITAARSLLSSAKNLGRLYEDSINEIGAIDFQSYSSGLSVPGFIKDLSSADDKKTYTRRPYRVYLNNKDKYKNEIHYLINNLVDDTHKLSISLTEDYSKLYEFIKFEIKSLTNYSKTDSVLANFRNKTKKVSSFFSDQPLDFSKEKQMALAFVMYQTFRQRENLSQNTYIKLFNLIGNLSLQKGIDQEFFLFDSIELLKFLSGGLL